MKYGNISIQVGISDFQTRPDGVWINNLGPKYTVRSMIFDVTNDPISLLFLSLDLDPPNVAPALEAMATAASRDQRVKKLQRVGGAV